VLLAAMRDLQWRRRRFAVTVVGTSVVLALTVVLTGLASTFDREARETVDLVAADGWVVETDAAGPFIGSKPIAESTVGDVASLDGVEVADAMAFGRLTLADGQDLNVFGVTPGGVGAPVDVDGRAIEADGEVIASTRVGVDVGGTLALGQDDFTVVGTVPDSTALSGIPNVFTTVADAQALVYAGQPIITTVAVRTSGDDPVNLGIEGLRFLGPEAAFDDLVRPVEDAGGAVAFLSVLLWLVAGLIVGSVIYLSAIERTQDFAVFKATGTSSAAIAGGLIAQSVVLTLVAAALAAGLAAVLAPMFPLRVVISRGTYLFLPLVAVGLGVVASLAGLRRVTSIDPALAFGGP
jgi:putative ABC transport system permease protein